LLLTEIWTDTSAGGLLISNGFSTAMATILPIFSSIVINAVIVTAGTFEP
jgi:hypothetical protein